MPSVLEVAFQTVVMYSISYHLYLKMFILLELYKQIVKIKEGCRIIGVTDWPDYVFLLIKCNYFAPATESIAAYLHGHKITCQHLLQPSDIQSVSSYYISGI